MTVFEEIQKISENGQAFQPLIQKIEQLNEQVLALLGKDVDKKENIKPAKSDCVIITQAEVEEVRPDIEKGKVDLVETTGDVIIQTTVCGLPGEIFEAKREIDEPEKVEAINTTELIHNLPCGLQNRLKHNPEKVEAVVKTEEKTIDGLPDDLDCSRLSVELYDVEEITLYGLEVIQEDVDENTSDSEQNESEVTVIENAIDDLKSEDEVEPVIIHCFVEPVVLPVCTETTISESISVNRTLSTSEVTGTRDIVTSESIIGTRTISTSEPQNEIDNVFIAPTITATSVPIIGNRTVSTSEPPTEPNRTRITSEDIFSEAAKIGAAKQGSSGTDDIFADSAQIGFLSRK